MGIKSWLFGKDKQSGDKETEAIALLKKRLNSLEIEGRNMLRKAEEQKTVAKTMLKQGNKIGAKQALTRSSLHMQKYNQIQNQSLNLSTQIDTISSAKSAAETVKALQVGSQVVEKTLHEVSPEDVERTMIEMDDQRDRIAMMSEALSDTTSLEMDLDGEFVDSIDDQLASLEMEIQAESHGSLPEAGTRTNETLPESSTEEANTDLTDELKALKKELEGDT
ncbi:MAG: Snf7 family protein [Candidatus Heimdallarchaeota archaeon]|nr:Snf7 family protein [Candidatus Heimdallarchaeota archaeon]